MQKRSPDFFDVVLQVQSDVRDMLFGGEDVHHRIPAILQASNAAILPS